MSITLENIWRKNVGNHVFVIGHLPYHNGWMTTLAQKYIEMRGKTQTLLSSVSLDGLSGFDMAKLESIINEAVVPYPESSDVRKNLAVIRSDLGEALNYILLEQEYGCQFAVNLVADRELRDLPGRGIDAIGIEHPDFTGGDMLRIVFSEVKVSDEAKSPPSVVHAKKDSMHKQLLGHMINRNSTLGKIVDAAKKARSQELRDLFMEAVLKFEFQPSAVELVAHCFLVRPADHHTESDFGKFKEDPDAYHPANIRFEIVCVPERVNTVVDKWYEEIVSAGGLNRE